MPAEKKVADDVLIALRIGHASNAEISRRTGLTPGQVTRRLQAIDGKTPTRKTPKTDALPKDNSVAGIQKRFAAAGVAVGVEADDEDDDSNPLWDPADRANYLAAKRIRDAAGAAVKDKIRAVQVVTACRRAAIENLERETSSKAVKAFMEEVVRVVGDLSPDAGERLAQWLRDASTGGATPGDDPGSVPGG